MIIRKANENDAKDLNWLLTLLIRDEKKYDDNINENFVVTNMYENYIEDQNRCILVAEENNKIIGYLYGYYENNDLTINNRICFLDALYVNENYRNKGIANQLINLFKKWCIDNNAKTIEVNVCSKNINAKNLYSNQNFITTKETMEFKII
jgi:ribosomal protein S18 acetylase RimI-like enzyme